LKRGNPASVGAFASFDAAEAVKFGRVSGSTVSGATGSTTCAKTAVDAQQKATAKRNLRIAGIGFLL
jgi:predicted negative regulator of RcsB-dependent stress response